METTVSILGGIGLFLLGMAVMTDGLKALAGSALRTVLAKAAATSVSGTFWGAVVTLLVQSSSATTMTTIGLVSAGLLTFPQGLSLVFGANIGTTGTGWLVALLGVRVSLTAYALPIVFVGALLKLIGKGRWAAGGAAVAGFALILVGLTTLQQGMGGLAERLHPADLPAVLGESGVPSWSGALGVLTLVATGIVMTTVMQSSTAAITVTISALFAGAIGLDQALALVIGQNIGTSTSSAMAAIGASSTAKRLAVAYIAFKLVAALIALVTFPAVVRLMVRATGSIDPVTLVAAYHTAYNVVGVAILLPLMAPFTRLVERIVPEKGSAFTRYLDPAALAAAPTVAIEATRRTVSHVLEASSLSAADSIDVVVTRQALDALQQAKAFLSKVTEPLVTEREQQWLISTVHALDHALGFVETLRESARIEIALDSPAEERAMKLCAESMRSTAELADSLEHIPAPPSTVAAALEATTVDSSEVVERLEHCAKELAGLRLEHRRATLDSVASGRLTANDAIARVEAVRLLDQRVHHAWRAAAHLAAAIA
ncbi:MAG: Na/Pi cotransporter family protein [Alphaproteobacteria bacterium]|nr:Na/Pi cotransporter family protein [Alphaproteobacteria bacterium]MBV8412925.1 Na/Pi cotransporter family protein [Alphaproteobacteria bacterium]